MVTAAYGHLDTSNTQGIFSALVSFEKSIHLLFEATKIHTDRRTVYKRMPVGGCKKFRESLNVDIVIELQRDTFRSKALYLLGLDLETDLIQMYLQL